MFQTDYLVENLMAQMLIVHVIHTAKFPFFSSLEHFLNSYLHIFNMNRFFFSLVTFEGEILV